MTDAEINATKATEDPTDDVMPLAGAPKKGTKSKLTLNSINETLKSINFNLRREEDPERVKTLKARRKRFEAMLDNFDNSQLPINENDNNADLNSNQYDWENYRDDKSN